MSVARLVPSMTTMYHTVGLLLRAYATIVVIMSLYSALWALELAGYLDQQVVAVIWIAIAAMGTVFLVLLIPLYWSSRSNNRHVP